MTGVLPKFFYLSVALAMILLINPPTIVSVRNKVTYSWSEWEAWPIECLHNLTCPDPDVDCPKNCGTGRRCRKRMCLKTGDEQKIAYDVTLCRFGSDKDCELCANRLPCTEVPHWVAWSKWSHCQPATKDVNSKDYCTIGRRFRQRECDTKLVRPEYFDQTCNGKLWDIEEKDCPMNCYRKVNPESDILEYMRFMASEYNIENYMKRKSFFQTHYSVKSGESVKLICDQSLLETLLNKWNEESINPVKNRPPLSHKEPPGITWSRNHQPLLSIGQYRSHGLYQTEPNHTVKSEFNWDRKEDQKINQIIKNVVKEVDRSSITIDHMREEWSGIYTCSLEWMNQLVVANMFFVTVHPMKINLALNSQFYLDSRLGIESMLALKQFVFFDSSRIVWYQNGVIRYEGMAASLLNRVILIGQMQPEHAGEWVCYLDVYLAPVGSYQWERNKHFARHTLQRIFVNFEKYQQNPVSYKQVWNQFQSIKTLRVITLVMITVAIMLAVQTILNGIAVSRWMRNSIGFQKNRIIAEERLDDIFKWLLLVRARAKRRLRDMHQPFLRMDTVTQEAWVNVLKTAEKNMQHDAINEYGSDS